MTLVDVYHFIQSGGVLACFILAGWAILTRKVITRGEFDRFLLDYVELKKVNNEATAELIKQSATNARLVETLSQQMSEAARIRRASNREGPDDGR